jgi:predicted DNA-binding transcriptional regulator YafY
MRVEPSRSINQAALRHAMRDERKIRFAHQDLDGRSSERVVRRLIMAFYGPVWLLAAWCDLRNGFGVFRIDRMSAFSALETKFDAERGKTAQDFRKQDAENKQTTLRTKMKEKIALPAAQQEGKPTTAI